MAKDKKAAKPAPDVPPPAPEEDFYETPYIIGIVVFFALMALLLWHQGFFSSK